MRWAIVPGTGVQGEARVGPGSRRRQRCSYPVLGHRHRSAVQVPSQGPDLGTSSRQLEHSWFSDVREGLPVSGRSLRIGAHNHEYAEAYWFGNLGNYQHYVISNNEIGTGEFWFPVLREGPSVHRSGTLAPDDPQPAGQATPGSDEPDWSRFRAGTTINTLTVLGPARQPADLAEPRGPDSTHVRVLVPGRHERRQIRRRLRRINRQSLRANKTQPPSQGPNQTELVERGS